MKLSILACQIMDLRVRGDDGLREMLTFEQPYIQSPLLLLTLNLYTTLDKNAYHQYNNRPEFDAG